MIKKPGILFLLLLVLASSRIVAQNQAANWYFGAKAGLDFNTGSPVPILDGELDTWEGCSSISLSTGVLRFYTDGTLVWDRHNDIMPNGADLNGNKSSTQSAIIVPKPGSTNLFYIFTVDMAENGFGTKGLQYSLVDMNLHSFLGDVVTTEKNVTLVSPVCEKVTAIGHANGTDIWIITQKWGTNDFYSYLVTTSGVNQTPVISSAGIVIGGTDPEDTKGYLKVSPDGKKLAKANAGLRSIEIFDFNTTTGVVSDQNIITDNGLGGEPYGVEFSPNGKLLYINSWKNNPGKVLYQYNLEAPDVAGSRFQLATGTNGALQLAPDNKIYIAQDNSSLISVIDQPNELGSACNFHFRTVSLGGKESTFGLPPFVQSFFKFNPGFYYDNSCFGDSTQFHENSSSEPDSLIWDFGDGSKDSVNFDPKHLYASTGIFFVKLTVWIDGTMGSVTHIILISEKANVNLGNDTTFCSGDTLLLDAGNDAESYLWQSGDTTNTFVADTSGVYWVKASNKTCHVYDSIDVTVLPSYFSQIDTSFCAGDSVYAGGEYRKTTGDYYDSLYNYIGCDSIIKTSLVVHDTFLVQQQIGRCNGDSVFVGGAWQKVSGIYYDYYQTSWGCDSTIKTELTISDAIVTQQQLDICTGDSIFAGGGWQTSSGTYYDTMSSVWGCDSISVTELTVTDAVETQSEESICYGDSIFAEGGWQKTEGVYIDSALSASGCDSIHTMQLFVHDVYNITWDTLICEGDSIYAGGGYQNSPGTYTDYLMTIQGCDSTVQTQLSVTLLPVVDLGNDTSILDGQTVTLDATGTPNATYLWQDGSTDSVYVVSDSGTYSVTVSNLCGYKEDSIKVTIYFPPEDLECFAVAPNAFTPNGDELNDIFRPVLQCPAETYSLKIFSRWGKLIFETSNPAEGWDGTVNGKPVEHGTYAWTIYYKYTGVLHPGERTVKGLVNLIR